MSQSNVYNTIPGSGSMIYNYPSVPGALLTQYAQNKQGHGVYITNFEDVTSLYGPIRTSNVGVTTAYAVLPSGGNMARRRSISLFNNSPTTVYIGHQSGQNLASMFPLPQNASITLDMMAAFPIFARTAAGSADIRVLEVM